MSVARNFVAAIVKEGNIGSLMKLGPVAHLFRANEKELWEFCDEHLKKHHKLPKPETILAHTGEDLPEATEPASYYHELLVLRHVELEIKKSIKDAASNLTADNKDPNQALAIMAESVMQLIATKFERSVHDFREAYDLIVPDYTAKWNKEEGHGLEIGWPTVDEMTGGLLVGDMVSLVGRPATGKTWQMLFNAHHAWQRHAARVMFVSMEMKVLPIEQRLAAMNAHIPATMLKNGALSTTHFDKVKSTLKELKGFQAPFWVVDGNFTATVEDVYVLARQLKPDIIFIDGGYLMKHPRERDRYKRVAENADMMKQQLSDMCPIVVSWQFAKTATKKNWKKGEKPGMEDIGYSDAIPQVSSLVLATMQEESLETKHSRVIDILKGRNGEVGEFKTHWDFYNMDFTEIVPQSIEQLVFM